MKPFDIRLLRYAVTARSFLFSAVILAFLNGATLIGCSWFLSQSIVLAISAAPYPEIFSSLGAVVACYLLRSFIIWISEMTSARAAARVKNQLRRHAFDAIRFKGPAWLSSRNRTSISTVLGSGLDALDSYFSLYLPQLILTAIVTPSLIVVLFISDAISGITVLVTMPLIPIFMILIGWATQSIQRQQWESLNRLSRSFLDVVAGLSTLKIFRRENKQLARIRSITDDYRVRTMKVLRVSFLSGFTLELIASLSVAVVAVSIGLRLINADMSLSIGLFVLLLTPEVFLPLRQVGAHFHASAEGVAAFEDLCEILEGSPAAATSEQKSTAGSAISLEKRDLILKAVTVRRGGKTVVSEISTRFPAGSFSVITGESGAGKSSLFLALLRFCTVEGSIGFEGNQEEMIPLERSDIAWSAQQPGLVAGSIAHNVMLGSNKPSEKRARYALNLAVASSFDLQQKLGVNGVGLSGGQAQRVALARAFYRAREKSCRIILLDEPTSALDPQTEARVIEGFRQLARSGHTVIVSSHRPAVIQAAEYRFALSPEVA